jgi:hypothetical protein
MVAGAQTEILDDNDLGHIEYSTQTVETVVRDRLKTL